MSLKVTVSAFKWDIDQSFTFTQPTTALIFLPGLGVKLPMHTTVHEFIHGENKDFLINYCIISMMIPLANDINPSLMRTPRLPFSFSMMCSTTTNAKKYGIACLTIKLKLFQKLSFRYGEQWIFFKYIYLIFQLSKL